MSIPAPDTPIPPKVFELAADTERNYGPGWEDALIAAYGVEPDRARLAYYRELRNAT